MKLGFKDNAIINKTSQKTKRHNSLEIILVKSGEIEITYGNSTYSLEKDSIFIIAPNTYHSILSKSDDTGFLYLLIPNSYIDFDFRTVSFDVFLHDDNVLSMILEIENLYNKKKREMLLKIKSLICEFFFYLFEQKKLHITEINKSIKRNEFDAVINYIEQNYLTNITLDSISKQTYYSKTWIWGAFKAAFGESPISYIKSLRVEYAKNLLKTTNMSLQEIAFISYFTSLKSFILFFTKKYGLSPIEYRNTRKDGLNG